MNTAKELLIEKLKNSGHSITTARLAVFDTLDNSEPQTMNEIVKQIESSVNRASIYRVVALFEQLGIVQRLQIGWKYKLELSNEFQDHHHHLTCVRCGTVSSFEEPNNLDDLLAKIGRSKDFIVQSHQLELQGLCAACQNIDPSQSMS